MLIFRYWAACFNLNFLSNLRSIASIMSLELLPLGHVLLVLRMLFISGNRDYYRVFHLVGNHSACKNFFTHIFLSGYDLSLNRKLGARLAQSLAESRLVGTVNL